MSEIRLVVPAYIQTLLEELKSAIYELTTELKEQKKWRIDKK